MTPGGGGVDESRWPCDACGESIAKDARLCPHCRSSALVDVTLPYPVADGRVRYQAARAVSALGAPVPAFVPLQTAMAAPQPVIARGLTRSAADRMIALLEQNGVGGALIVGRAVPVGDGRGRTVATLAGALAVAAVVGWLVMRSDGPRAGARDAARSGAADPAGSGAASAARPAEIASARDVAQRALPSTVSLRCAGSVGSGFFVGDETVLTNAHVLCPAGENLKVVFSDGHEGVGVPLRADEALDLAVVRVPDAHAPALPLGDATMLRVGDPVMMIGSPVGMEFSVGTGTVSNVGRVVLGVAYVQIDAKVNPGNSGGALLDAAGRVVGIVSMKRADAEGIGLVLPINYAFAGGQSLVPAPASVDPAAFEQMVAQAQAADQEAASRLAQQAPQGPALMDARVDGDRHLAVLVARMAQYPPRYEDVTFRLWQRGTRLCTVKTQVLKWEPLESAQGARGGMDARVAAWAQRNGLDRHVYVGVASLSLAECASLEAGMELELEGADGRADRVVLR
jgi:S1-C subfamily serine protease